MVDFDFTSVYGWNHWLDYYCNDYSCYYYLY